MTLTCGTIFEEMQYMYEYFRRHYIVKVPSPDYEVTCIVKVCTSMFLIRTHIHMLKPIICHTPFLIQRIERWWGHLRNTCAQFYMNLFKDMEELGLFNRQEPLHV